MTPAEYRLFLDDVCRRYDAETAARIIEDHCRGPYKPPRRGVLFSPASSVPAAGKGTAGEPGGLQAVSGPGGAA